MAKGGKLTKLKSVIKKWHSFGKLNRTASSISAANSSDNEDQHHHQMISSSASLPKNNLYPVYVGMSRRRYLVGSDVIGHPLFQELVGKSNGSNDMIISCEVVLFEHLIWMIENGDPQPESSLRELVQFYAC